MRYLVCAHRRRMIVTGMRRLDATSRPVMWTLACQDLRLSARRHKTPSVSPHFKHGASFTTNIMRRRENSVLRSACGYSTHDVTLRISNTLPAKRTYRVAKPAPAQPVRRSKRLEEQGRRRLVVDDTRCSYHLPSPESETNIKAVCKCDLKTEYGH
jgi:hypothetical protein